MALSASETKFFFALHQQQAEALQSTRVLSNSMFSPRHKFIAFVESKDEAFKRARRRMVQLVQFVNSVVKLQAFEVVMSNDEVVGRVSQGDLRYNPRTKTWELFGDLTKDEGFRFVEEQDYEIDMREFANNMLAPRHCGLWQVRCSGCKADPGITWRSKADDAAYCVGCWYVFYSRSEAVISVDEDSKKRGRSDRFEMEDDDDEEL